MARLPVIQALADTALEEAVLGALLTSDPAVERVLGVGLGVDDFYAPSNAVVFEAVLRVRDRGEPVDELTVKAGLERTGDLAAAGGSERLSAMSVAVSAPGNAAVHAERLRELSRLRHLSICLDEAREGIDRGSFNGEIHELSNALSNLNAGNDGGQRLLDLEGLRNLSAPGWLIRDHLVEQGLNLLYGVPGAGKSFLALDWSLSIATGRSWLGSPVEPGLVIYVAAEGAGGLRNRIESWVAFHDVDNLERFWIWPAPLNLYAGETAALEAAIKRLVETPVLLVIDTVARSMAGGDENSTADMAAVIDEVARLQQRYEMAALLVHHPRKGSDEPRGNSALFGAVDVSRLLRTDGEDRVLVAKKTKDWQDPDPVGLAVEAFERSALIRPRTVCEAAGRLDRQAIQLLETIRTVARTDWFRAADIRDASNLGRSTVYEVLKYLTEAGVIEMRSVGAQAREYRVSSEGPSVQNRPKT